MNRKNVDNIEDLAREVVRLGRKIADEARKLYVGGTAMDAAFVNRALDLLSKRKPFEPAVDGGLAAVQGILNKDILGEVVGTEAVFVQTHFDELGPNGVMRDVPVYSERGAELVRLRDLFEDFLRGRETVQDHVAAHRALHRGMSV